MYVGQTYRVRQMGGWNANPDLDAVPKEGMTDVVSINIHRGGRQPRGGCEKVNSTAITGTPGITGIYHFIRENGQLQGFEVVDESTDNIGDENGDQIVSEGADIFCATDDGKLFKNYTTELTDDFTSNQRYYFETYYDQCFISNGLDKPQISGENLDYTWDMGGPRACTAALAGAGAGNVDNGTHSYKVTYVSASGESSGGPKSNVVTTTAGDGQVNLTDIPTGPTGTTSRKIYRTVAGDTGNHKLLATISDNTTTTYADNTADSGLGADSPTTSLAFLPTDWQSDWPKVFLKHGRGVHARLWAIGSESNPNKIYASVNGVADFSDDNVVVIRIMEDLLTGMVEFGNNLIVFSRYKTYIINDAPIAIINWGYQAAHWDGGAAHQNVIVSTPTDVAVMSEDGNIFSIRASEQYGDYEIASLTKPHHIDKWIEDNIDLTQIDKFHAVYDSDLRAIKWFMVKTGSDYPDVCLLYFIDYNMWTKHEYTNVYDTTISHLCSTIVKVSQTIWKVYTGDEGGFAYSLESDTLLDNGIQYESYFETPPMPIDHPRISKIFDRLWLVVNPQGTEELRTEVFIDGESMGTSVVSMSGDLTRMKNINMDVGDTGLRIQVKISNRDDQDFYVSEVMLDFQLLGSADEYAYATSGLIPDNTAYTFGGANTAEIADVDLYNSVANSWVSRTNMTSPSRSGSAVVSLFDKGYVPGGYNTGEGGSVLDNDEYNGANDSWAAKSNLPAAARFVFRGANLLNKAYVFGGTTNLTDYLTDNDEYDSMADSWTAMTDVVAPGRYGAGTAVISDKAYVISGRATTGRIQDNDEYDSTGDSWANKTSLSTAARVGAGVCTVSSKGYCIGGDNNNGDANNDEYDAVGDSWTAKTDLVSPGRYYPGISSLSGKAYVFNGYDDADYLTDNDSYTPTGDSWAAEEDTPSPGRYLAGSM